MMVTAGIDEKIETKQRLDLDSNIHCLYSVQFKEGNKLHSKVSKVCSFCTMQYQNNVGVHEMKCVEIY